MPLIFISALIGVVLGSLVGYFMSTLIVGICTIVVVYMLYDMFRPRRGAGSGALGIVLLFGPGIVSFFTCMWLAWIFAPGGVPHSVDLSAVWQFTKELFLR